MTKKHKNSDAEMLAFAERCIAAGIFLLAECTFVLTGCHS